MCGIAGFSLSPNSNIHPRALSAVLLWGIEERGYMASGWAYGRENAQPRYHKEPVIGHKLDLSRIPMKATSMILHTRLATHGSIHDNRNNHPVLGPNKDIALVHNGVLWNHDSIRRQLPFELPDVDSSVAPALLQDQGIKGLAKISGDAAFMWLDKATGNTLHVVRQEHSPLWMAHVADGSKILASTKEILVAALDILDIPILVLRQLEELDYLQILDGEIISDTQVDEPVGFKYNFASSWRDQTSGGHGSEQKSLTVLKPGFRQSARYEGGWVPEGGWDDDQYDDYDWIDPDSDLLERDHRMMINESQSKYYITDNWGNDTPFRDLTQMLIALSFYQNIPTDPDMEAIFGDLDPEMRWVSNFVDIGEYDENGVMVSWIQFPNSMEEQVESIPSSVRDGIDFLAKFVM